VDTQHVAVGVVADVVWFTSLALLSWVKVLNTHATCLSLHPMLAHANRCSRPNREGAIT